MLRLNALLCVLVLALSACIESPPPSQLVTDQDMATDSDTQSDMGGDVVITPDMPDMPDMPDIDEPICFGEGDCPNDLACKVNEENSNLNECVECVDADDCGMGVCTENNRCVACIEDADCGDPQLTCSDANECIGCQAGGTCPTMANRCDPESEAPGTCVECLGDGNDTLCGTDEACDVLQQKCVPVPCFPADEDSGTQDTCAGNADNKHCKVVDEEDSLQNECVECLDSDDCEFGGCNSNTCVTCVEDTDCAPGKVCTGESDVNARTCVDCLGKSDCSGDDVCNLDTNLCVECVDDNECNGGVCDTNNTCVECLSNTDCPGEVCDTGIKQCVACLGDTDCAGTNQCRTIATDSTQNACVTCVNNNGCQSPSSSRCNPGANSCVQCTAPADCTHLGASYNYCDTASGCIECYGLTEAQDCGGNFCNLETNMCTTTPIPASPTPNLGGCNSSDECRAGSRCMPLQYTGGSIGNFCMPLGDSNQTCPRDSTQAYMQKDLRSPIDGGGNVLFCRLDESAVTPQAVLESGKTCATNTDCFATGSTCQQRDLATNRNCAYLCEDDSECKAGSTCRCPPSLNCALSGTPKYCLPPS